MVASLRPIETKYKGYRFRSRLEARWAVCFDTLGVKWEYEQEGYELGEAGKYLPDFWLPEHESWVEIKGHHENEDEQQRARLLHVATTFPVYIFSGEFDIPLRGWYTGTDSTDSNGGFGDFGGIWAYCPICSAISLKPFAWEESRGFYKSDWEPVASPCIHTGLELWRRGCLHSPYIRKAVDAARSARFEFGETGR